MGCQRQMIYWGQQEGAEGSGQDGSLSNEDIRIIRLGAGHGARNDEDKPMRGFVLFGKKTIT